MKKIHFIILISVFPLFGFCQNDTCTVSRYHGVLCKSIIVFSSGCSVPEIDKYINLRRITPTKDEAEKCDKIIDQFKQIFIAKMCKGSKNVAVFGQLIGYNGRGPEKIFVQQLFFLGSNERIEKAFPGFNLQYIVGLGGLYEKKTIILKVSIDNKTISIL